MLYRTERHEHRNEDWDRIGTERLGERSEDKMK